MAGKRDYYAVETQAHRDNYNAKDVEGRTLAEARGGTEYWKEMYQAPEVLETGIDTTTLLQNWKRNTSIVTSTTTSTTTKSTPTDPNSATPPGDATQPTGDLLRLSNDAGHYLCEFIYYTSLLEYWRREPKGVSKGERPVVFLHVPGQAEEEDLKRGGIVAIGLIKALVETREGMGKVEEGKGEGLVVGF